MPPPIKSNDMNQLISPLNEYLIAVKKPKVLTGINEVPTASIMVSPDIVCINAGTMINPPPIPKYPAAIPTMNPTNSKRYYFLFRKIYIRKCLRSLIPEFLDSLLSISLNLSLKSALVSSLPEFSMWV